MSGKGFIAPEAPRDCELCGAHKETRPYGPNGERICFDCGMKDREVTEARSTERILQRATTWPEHYMALRGITCGELANAARCLLALLDEREKRPTNIRASCDCCGFPCPACAEYTKGNPHETMPLRADASTTVIEPRESISVRPMTAIEGALWAAYYRAQSDAWGSMELAVERSAQRVCALRGEVCTPQHVEAFLRQVRGG